MTNKNPNTTIAGIALLTLDQISRIDAHANHAELETSESLFTEVLTEALRVPVGITRDQILDCSVETLISLSHSYEIDFNEVLNRLDFPQSTFPRIA